MTYRRCSAWLQNGRLGRRLWADTAPARRPPLLRGVVGVSTAEFSLRCKTPREPGRAVRWPASLQRRGRGTGFLVTSSLPPAMGGLGLEAQTGRVPHSGFLHPDPPPRQVPAELHPVFVHHVAPGSLSRGVGPELCHVGAVPPWTRRAVGGPQVLPGDLPSAHLSFPRCTVVRGSGGEAQWLPPCLPGPSTCGSFCEWGRLGRPPGTLFPAHLGPRQQGWTC